MDQAYESAVGKLPPALCERLLGFSPEKQADVREVTLRTGRPLTVTTGDGVWFLNDSGVFSRFPPSMRAALTAKQVGESLRFLTEYSLHSFEESLCGGYLTIKGGHRAGIAGTGVHKDGSISHIRDVCAISLRIARQVRGVSRGLLYALYHTQCIPSVLLVGAPASGKTTVLRDLIRSLAGGEAGRYVRVSVIDERSELGAAYQGEAQYDLGLTSELFDGFSKSEGMTMALRAMSPEIIAVDELGSVQDAEAVRQVQCGGAAVLATAHAQNAESVLKRPVLAALLKEGAFDVVVALKDANSPGEVAKICTAQELFAGAFA